LTAFQEGRAADDGESERSYPSLPEAVRECPEWLKKNTPFDIIEWFQVVPPEENAAPLYLDALYECSPQEMETCLAPAEVAERGAAVRNRVARTNAGMIAKPPGLSSELVDEYAAANWTGNSANPPATGCFVCRPCSDVSQAVPDSMCVQ